MQAGPDVVTRALEYTDDVIDRAEGMVSNFIDNATGQATTAMQSVGEGVYNSMPKSLPPNLQTKADVVRYRLVNVYGAYVCPLGYISDKKNPPVFRCNCSSADWKQYCSCQGDL